MVSNADTTGGSNRPRRTLKKKTTTVVDAAAATGAEEIIVRNGEAAAASKWPVLWRGRVPESEITLFLRQLIMLLEAGTTILKSLKTLAQRGSNPQTRALIADIAQYLEGGNALWQCFDRLPRYFDDVFVNLIKASEASGNLVPVLKRLVDYRAEREMLRKRVRGAMLYPLILVVACIAVMLIITRFVVPEFEEMFRQQNITIPAGTQWFLWCANGFSQWWWTPVIVIIALWLIYKYWFVRNESRRLLADRIKIKIPIMGKIIHKNAMVELSRTMSMLLRSGLSMMATLNLTRRAIHNRAVSESLQSVRDSIEQGGGMEEPLRANADVIPPVVTDMLVTGEESGRVDAIAEQIADIYEEEVRIAVNSMAEVLQPIFTVIIGGAVAALFISLFYPIVSMVQQISSGTGS
ncbi:MAG TPA: type II secretion system F family protein [Candidatus Hydrogenedentes bacterium]|nr:type II secretion system F family protein [Candidatus Hydrogenedentota bacterium]